MDKWLSVNMLKFRVVVVVSRFVEKCFWSGVEWRTHFGERVFGGVPSFMMVCLVDGAPCDTI